MKNKFIFGQRKKPASILIMTVLILNLVIISIVFYQNDEKILLQTLTAMEQDQRNNIQYWLAYQLINDQKDKTDEGEIKSNLGRLKYKKVTQQDRTWDFKLETGKDLFVRRMVFY